MYRNTQQYQVGCINNVLPPSPIQPAAEQDDSMLYIVLSVVAMTITPLLPIAGLHLYFLLGIFPLACSFSYRKALREGDPNTWKRERTCTLAALATYSIPLMLFSLHTLGSIAGL